MAIRLPPLKALRVFEAAARHGNFTLAAQELNITHSAVSQQIKLLEDFLGQALFTREARGVVLLPHAKAYFVQVQDSLERIADATSALRAPDRRRSLNVCTTPSMAMKWLIPRLSDFQAMMPLADVQLTTLGSAFIEQADSSVDVLIRHSPMQRPGYTCVRCLPDYLVPVASPRFMARHALGTAADCLGHPLLQVAGELTHWPRWFDLAGVRVPSQLPGPVFDHQFLCLQAAANDLGLTLAPWSLLEEDLRADRLRVVFTHPQLVTPGVYALHRTDDGLSQSFVAWLGAQGHRPFTGPEA
ncbi:MAG: LysR family transcriptional regulator [Ideonella sp. MAG2]|nr:MAG: LysR family transcriptional regulator [Ideonella sp. MAG2]